MGQPRAEARRHRNSSLTATVRLWHGRTMSTLDEIERLLRSHRFRSATEGELGDLIAAKLAESFPADCIEREVNLRDGHGQPLGRIDFRIAAPVVYVHGCSAAHQPDIACEHGAVCITCMPRNGIGTEDGPAEFTHDADEWDRPWVGLELKARGGDSRAKTLRQASRYLLDPTIVSLVVAAPASGILSGWPRELAGKPVRTVHIRSFP